jgi:protein-glutamine gamma-glutamyltransferase
MDFKQGLAFSSRMVALSALLSLFLTREAPDWLVAPAILFVLLGMLRTRYARPVLGKRPVAAIVVAASVFAVFDFLYVGGSLIVAGADFLVLLLVVKLLSLNEYKDYAQLYIISFFLLLSSTGLSTEFSFLFSFMLFFLSLAWAMILLTMKGESEALTGKEPRWKVNRKFFVSTALLTLCSTAFTLVIFFVIPRVGIGYFSKRAGGAIKISGFSDNVKLGSMGEFLLDPTTVMRVQLQGDKPPESELYWRGKVFDYYNGSSWENRLSSSRVLLKGPAASFILGAEGPAPRKCVTQRIMLEPLDTPTLFALYPAYVMNGDFRAVLTDRSGAFSLSTAPEGRISYTACSVLFPPKKAAAARREAKDANYYLQLPDGIDELKALAGRITRRSDSPTKKALEVQDYLETNYSYSLEPGGKNGEDPVNNFLFHSKKGYCEHFATSMVLLLRATGVPARLVSGFHGGEWNEYGGYYTVRAQDAHTWVEAYIKNSGWVRFDPTPPAPIEQKSVLFGVAGLVDYLRYKWDRYIVFYSLRDQAGAAKHLIDFAARLREVLRSFKTPSGRGLQTFFRGRARPGKLPASTAAALVLLVIAGAAVLLKGKFSKISRAKKRLGGFYSKLLNILRKKGINKGAAQTPREFAGYVLETCGPAYSEIPWITEAYNRARFGGPGLVKEEMERIEAALAALESAPPPPPPPPPDRRGMQSGP